MATVWVRRPEHVHEVRLGGPDVRLLARGDVTDGRVALFERPIEPRSLASPIHTHEREDEISCVIAWQVGEQIGDPEIVAGPGTMVFKPRNIPHAF
jgi:hypothetical protein